MSLIISVTLRKQRHFYVTVKFIVWLPQQPKLKTAFDSFIASTFTTSFFFPIWGWCGDYVKAVRWNQISHQRACRSELWLCRGDTYSTTEAYLTLIRLGIFLMIAAYSKSTEANALNARWGCGSRYCMWWISHFESITISKNWNFKYSGGRSLSSQLVLQRGPPTGMVQDQIVCSLGGYWRWSL